MVWAPFFLWFCLVDFWPQRVIVASGEMWCGIVFLAKRAMRNLCVGICFSIWAIHFKVPKIIRQPWSRANPSWWDPQPLFRSRLSPKSLDYRVPDIIKDSFFLPRGLCVTYAWEFLLQYGLQPRPPKQETSKTQKSLENRPWQPKRPVTMRNLCVNYA